MSPSRFLRRGVGLALVASLAIVAIQYSAPAEARGHRAGWFVGGLFVGAALGPRYVYPAPVYYYPPTYYSPAPVVYTSPPVVIQQPAPMVAPAPAPAPVVQGPLSIEQRLHRLRSMCDQGLFTPHECDSRRAQILQEM